MSMVSNERETDDLCHLFLDGARAGRYKLRL